MSLVFGGYWDLMLLGVSHMTLRHPRGLIVCFKAAVLHPGSSKLTWGRCPTPGLGSIVPFGGCMRALIAILVLSTPSLAQAQSVAEARSWTATPFVNVTFGTSGDTTTSSLGLGAAAGYDVTSNLGFEGELGHIFDIQGDSDSVDWSLTTFTANVVYHFDVLRVTPYATAGLGWQRSSIDIDLPLPDGDTPDTPTDSKGEIVYNFGGGIKYKLADNMLARADLRRFQANDLSPDYWRLYGGITFILRR